MAAAEVVALGALVAGTLDIAATGAVMRAQGVSFRRLLQFVASGALGGSAVEGGAGTAALGLALHFLVAVIWAAIYYGLARVWPVLLAQPLLCGSLFGVVAHVTMSRVVVPLSRAAKRPFMWKAWLMQLGIHMVCVGMPIAVVESYWLR